MQPRSTLALPLTIRAWLAKCKLHFAGRLFFRWLTLVTFLLGLVAALALYVSDLGHLRAQEVRASSKQQVDSCQRVDDAALERAETGLSNAALPSAWKRVTA